MKEKIKRPSFFSGEIYFVDDFNLKIKTNLKKEFDKVEYNYAWNLSRGTIIPNGNNEKLKFDINPPSEYYESYFSGFLYPDSTLLGKIKYNQDAKEKDCIIKGEFKKINKNTLLIRGIWDDTKGGKDCFWIELKVQ